MTPTERTLSYLARNGYIAGVVERWIPGANQRKDLFGIIDILAISDTETLGVQSTGTDFVAHSRKILESKLTKDWLLAGRRLILIGWRKVKQSPGKGTRMVYKPRIAEFTLDEDTLVMSVQAS